MMTEDQREHFNERAAIMEFDGGLSREDAQVECMVTPVAWLHDQPERYDVIHDEVKKLWLRAKPKQVEHYTIPLYRRDLREPMSTDAACALLKEVLGIDPMLDGNLLKMLRSVERAHGIETN